MPNLGRVHRNPEFFPEPYKFNPDRYLDKEGKFVASPKVVPFGVGKRRCLGETLAKAELYMFFTAILSRFDLAKGSESDILTDSPIMGSVQSPQPYKIRFIARH